MGAPRLVVASHQLQDSGVVIEGQDHAHLARVLRIRPGDTVIVLDGSGNDYYTTVESVSSGKTRLRLDHRIAGVPEPSISICVAQSLGKGDRFEQVLQHGTEAGAAAFTPLLADRCNVEIPSDRIENRMVRWQAILKGAVEQSGRSYVPALSEPITTRTWIAQPCSEDCLTILLHEAAGSVPLRALLESMPAPRSIRVAVGPEGGWSGSEIEAATAAGIRMGSAGPRILRTETAALVAVSQILYHFNADQRSE